MKKLVEGIKQKMEAREVEEYGRVLSPEERDEVEERRRQEAIERERQYEATIVFSNFMKKVPARYKQASFDSFEGHEEKVEFLKSGKSAVIFGGNGTGKTHLGYALCRHFAEQGKYARYVLAYEFFEDIKDSFDRGNTRSVLRGYAGHDYLVIDEVDKAYGSPTEFVHLYHLVNERYNRMLPTVLITNATNLVEQLGSSVLDRIASDGAIIEMAGENYRKKQGGKA